MLARGANTPNFHLPFSLFLFTWVLRLWIFAGRILFFSPSSFFFRFSFLFDCSCISSAFSRTSYFRMMFWTIPTETNDDGLYPADAVNCVGKGESREFTMEDAVFFSRSFILSFPPRHHFPFKSQKTARAWVAFLLSFLLFFFSNISDLPFLRFSFPLEL